MLFVQQQDVDAVEWPADRRCLAHLIGRFEHRGETCLGRAVHVEEDFAEHFLGRRAHLGGEGGAAEDQGSQRGEIGRPKALLRQGQDPAHHCGHHERAGDTPAHLLERGFGVEPLMQHQVTAGAARLLRAERRRGVVERSDDEVLLVAAEPELRVDRRDDRAESLQLLRRVGADGAFRAAGRARGVRDVLGADGRPGDPRDRLSGADQLLEVRDTIRRVTADQNGRAKGVAPERGCGPRHLRIVRDEELRSAVADDVRDLVGGQTGADRNRRRADLRQRRPDLEPFHPIAQPDGRTASRREPEFLLQGVRQPVGAVVPGGPVDGASPVREGGRKRRLHRPRFERARWHWGWSCRRRSGHPGELVMFRRPGTFQCLRILVYSG